MFCHEKTGVPLFYSFYDVHDKGVASKLRQEANSMGIKQTYTICELFAPPMLNEESDFSVWCPVDREEGSLEEDLGKKEEVYRIGELLYALLDCEANGVMGSAAFFFLSHKYQESKGRMSLVEYLVSEIRRDNVKRKSMSSNALKIMMRDIRNYGYAAIFSTGEIETQDVLERFYVKDIMESVLPHTGSALNPGQIFIAYITSIILRHIDLKLGDIGMPLRWSLDELSTIYVKSADGINFVFATDLNEFNYRILNALDVDLAKLYSIERSLRVYS
jgi:hypothetical protein